MAQLRIGTCSWKYDSWRGLVYSQDQKINYLKEYSQTYDTVEIDQWFWSLRDLNKIILPRKDVVINYKESVTPSFKFTVKLPDSVTLTHIHRAEKENQFIPNHHFLSHDLLEEFIASIKPLHKNLGPLMFQFEYLNKEKIKSQFEFQGLMREFAAKLRNEFQFAIETRNPDYLNETYFQFLRDNKFGHVFLHGYNMPPVFDVYEKFKDYIKGYTVIRLHGPDRQGIETRAKGEWNKIIDPKDAELEKIINMVKELLERKIDIYLNVNNYYEGSAPLTIQKIKKLLSKDDHELN